MSKIYYVTLVSIFFSISCTQTPKKFDQKTIKENLDIKTVPITLIDQKIKCTAPGNNPTLKKLVDLANSCLREENLEILNKVNLIIANEYSQHPWANYYQSVIYTQKNEYDKALLYVNEALFTSPNLGLINYQKSLILNKQNKLTAAVAFSKKAIELSPKIVGAHTLLVSLLIEQSKFKEAKMAIDQAIRIYPDNVHFKISLGDIYLSQEKYKKALSQFNQLRHISKYKDEINYKLSFIYSNIENEKLAHKHLAMISTPSISKLDKKYQDNILEKLNSFKENSKKVVSEQSIESSRTPAENKVEQGGAR